MQFSPPSGGGPRERKGVQHDAKINNLQDLFLLRARSSRPCDPVSDERLSDPGADHPGFDAFVVVVCSEGKQQVIYKHAISTIHPERPVDLRPERGAQPVD